MRSSGNSHWTKESSYRPDIDGLRAIAVLAVVLYHAFPQWVRGGFIGVDIFFVISGYLITSIILADLEKDSFSFRSFYASRIIRIFPALTLVLLAVLSFGWIELLAREYKQLGLYAAASALFFTNLLAQSDSGNYFDAGAEEKPLLHLWSLGVEEQFYIVWPLMLVFFFRSNRKVLIGIAGVGLFSFLIGIWLSFTAPAIAFYSPITRFFELMMGGYLSYQARNNNDAVESYFRHHFFLNILSLAGAILIAMGLLLIDSKRIFPGAWVLLPTVGTALLIKAGPTAWINRYVLQIKPLVWIGLISFPLYLWHWPLLSFAHIVEGGMPAREVRALCVFVAIALAWLTYRYLEIPIRLRKYRNNRAWQRQVALRLLLVMGMIAVFGATLFLFQGLKNRIPHLQSYEQDFSARENVDLINILAPCTSGVSHVAKCLSTGKSATEKIVVIGDSHGAALSLGLFKAVNEVNSSIELVYHSIGGCLPLRGVESYDQLGNSRGCRDDNDAMYKWVIADRSVKSVVLVSRWASRVGDATGFGSVDGGTRSGIYRYFDENGEVRGNSEVFIHGLRRTIENLTAAGKRVFFVHQVPEFGFYPPFCGRRPIPLANWHGNANRCSISRSLVEARQSEYRSLFDAVKTDFPALVTIDPLPVFCNAAECSLGQDSSFFYRDDDHLNSAGAYRFSKTFVEKLF